MTNEQTHNRVRDSQARLKVLQVQQSRSWHDIVTFDESSFYLNTDHNRLWLVPGETPPDRERHIIQLPKFISIVLWGVTRFHVVKLLPKGDIFNACYCINEILSKIAFWREGQRGASNRKMIVHVDNARPHPVRSIRQYIESCKMIRPQHPPYSPDLAPSYFSLFGYLNNRLQGQHFETGEDLLAAMIELIGIIERATLEKVFLKWMERCISTNGEYIGGDEQ
jgi:histone-lysine N-methyltransferase SETMAR